MTVPINGTPNITKCIEWKCRDRPAVDIFGLNVFTVNNIVVSEEEDPKTIFLRHLVSNSHCSAQIGLYPLEIEMYSSLEEILGRPGSKSWRLSPVGIVGSEFYTKPPIQDIGALIIDVESLIGALDDESSVFDCLVRWDAVALFLGCMPNVSTFVERLQNMSFISDADWLTSCLNSCGVIVMPDNDAQLFHVYLNEHHNIVKIYSALDLTSASIKQSKWYTENQNDLKWSEDKMCLIAGNPDHD